LELDFFVKFYFKGIKLKKSDEWRVDSLEIGWEKIPQNDWVLRRKYCNALPLNHWRNTVTV